VGEVVENYKVLKNEYYELFFPNKYDVDMKEILEYSTKRLIYNLNFFDKDSYGKVIHASFFDKKEAFLARIHELDKKATPPDWATGCFYGEENQILFEENNIKDCFYTLAHESCHLLFQKFIYNKYKDRIVWLDESFAANFSGEVEKEMINGEFIKKVKKYLNCNTLPKMNEISFQNNNIKTVVYNAYDLFHIVGRYLLEIYSQEELLKFYKDEERVLKSGETILNESLLYFKQKFSL